MYVTYNYNNITTYPCYQRAYPFSQCEIKTSIHIQLSVNDMVRSNIQSLS